MIVTFPNVIGTIEVYMDCLRAMCLDTAWQSMIDVGCCFAPNTPTLGFKERTYIDVIDRVLDHPSEQPYFTRMDGLELSQHFKPHQFSTAICSDMIEHISHDEGYKLIREIEKISVQQIFFTPTTDLFGMAGPGNIDPEAHRCVWTPKEFHQLGYNCVVFPDYHKVWNGGSFFAFSSKIHYQDIIKEIKSKSWAKS